MYSEPTPVSLRDCIRGKVEEVKVRKEKFRVTLGVVIRIQVTFPPFAGIF